MATTCRICTHEQRKDIDYDLIDGATIRDIAGRYDLSKSSVDRHRRNCLAARWVRALAREEDATEELLVKTAYGVLDRQMFGVVKAEREEDWYGHRAYLEGARKTIETLARLGGIGRADVTVESKSAHISVLAGMSEDELRALARGVIDTPVAELPPASVPAAL